MLNKATQRTTKTCQLTSPLNVVMELKDSTPVIDQDQGSSFSNSLTSGLPLRSLEDALQLKRTWLVCPDSNCDTLKVHEGLLGRRSHCGKRTLEVVDVECPVLN